MRYNLGKGDWQTRRQGQSRSFLLTNGLGGYCSQTVIGSNARGDHGLLIGAQTAPSKLWTMVQRLDEILYIDDSAFVLSSQSFVTETKNKEGQQYLDRFCLDCLPEWEYTAEGVRVIKRLGVVYGTNSLAVTYRISACPGQKAWLSVTPVYGFHEKNDHPAVPVRVRCAEMDCGVLCMETEDICLYLKTDGAVCPQEEGWIPDYYYEQDAVDGREGWGGGITLHQIVSGRTQGEEETVLTLLYSMDEEQVRQACEAKSLFSYASGLFEYERERQALTVRQSGLSSEAAKQLAVSAAAFLTKRDSAEGMSIIAGFPFFGDWGRDTMVAFYGCTLALGKKETAKSILRTFMQYCRRGLMPNLFPEGDQPPLYNTVDASLLFLNAAWEYLECDPDPQFISELWPVAESIISWYAHGTDCDIRMEEDGLLSAGSGLWQLTWMDVRFGDILPTPRHGKPVEVNAYWYNGVRVLEQLLYLAEKPEQLVSLEDTPQLTEGWSRMGAQSRAAWLALFAQRIQNSFLEKFTKPDGTLYDVIPSEKQKEEGLTPDEIRARDQIRCNEVFALSLPFTMIGQEQAQAILGQIRRELYTPLGLRSLSARDEAFRPFYGGSQFNRDMAYHQGTVWVYPLGDYYRACLRYASDREKEAERIREALGAVEAAMAEGCLGQLPEIYDGKTPGASKGCYAQAWSTAQLLRVYRDLEKQEKGERILL